MPFGSSSVSVAVLAGLLSLLPVTILFWVYYLRERTPSVPARVISRFFAAGMIVVVPAVFIERFVFSAVQRASPAAAGVFFAESFSLATAADLLLALVVSFVVVALAEEGVRLLVLRTLFQRAAEVDQVVDGLQVGIASGIGFAFVENALYFLRLFEQLDFDTLAVVFFLRFFVSTFGHIAFGGIMGYELARAAADPLNRRTHLWRAFLVPWVAHGLFDFFLSVELSVYTVVLLLLPLFYLWSLYNSPQLHERFRLFGRLLRAPVRAGEGVRSWGARRRLALEQLPTIPWCPVCLAPLPEEPARADATGRHGPRRVLCPTCGTVLTRRVPESVRPPARVSLV